jgi:SNF family Na+-dependent transporter
MGDFVGIDQFCPFNFIKFILFFKKGGFYVFQLFDFYAASGWALLWLLFFECIAISWSVGINRWYDHLQSMIGYYPSNWWKFCWVFATPAVCMVSPSILGIHFLHCVVGKFVDVPTKNAPKIHLFSF